MPRNQWPRRKRSTKPENSGFGVAPPGGTSFEEAVPGAAEGGETPGADADAGADRSPERGRAGSSPRNVAFDILARREHSVAELRDKLLAREFPADLVEQTLSALIEEGLLSEQRFIDSFLASYTRRGHGPLWLRAELQRRGIDNAEIAAALAAQELAGHPVDWPAEARTVREKRFGPGPPTDYKDRTRQSRFLQYRGFSSDQIRQAFREDDED